LDRATTVYRRRSRVKPSATSGHGAKRCHARTRSRRLVKVVADAVDVEKVVESVPVRRIEVPPRLGTGVDRVQGWEVAVSRHSSVNRPGDTSALVRPAIFATCSATLVRQSTVVPKMSTVGTETSARPALVARVLTC
jgi:hypothetical protein